MVWCIGKRVSYQGLPFGECMRTGPYGKAEAHRDTIRKQLSARYATWIKHRITPLGE